MQPYSIVALLTAWVASTTPLLAHPHPRPHPGVELQVVVDGRTIGSASSDRGVNHVTVDQLGSEYILRIRNRLPVAIEAVVAVDGLSVINGERASDSIRGYLVQPHATLDIPGWRRGSRKVAAFKFSREEDSYAYRTGRPDGVGIILMTAFEQARVHPHPHPVLRDRRGISNFGAEAKSIQESRESPEGQSADRRVQATAGGLGGRARHIVRPEKIGTGYGRELDHHVSRVPFERSTKSHRLTIHYSGRSKFTTYSRSDFTPPPPGYQP